MRIRFLRDFQSMHTGEVFYEQYAVADLEPEHAQPLIAEGAAELVPLKAREGQVEPKAPETKAPEAKPATQVHRRIRR